MRSCTVQQVSYPGNLFNCATVESMVGLRATSFLFPTGDDGLSNSSSNVTADTMQTARPPWVANDAYKPYFQVSCAASMFGSVVIILTYLLFRDLRTTSRLLLVFLSLMDFGTALSNSIGMVAGFKETTTGCQVQAAFAIFCSLSSYFWTAAIALYLYFTIVRDQQFVAKKLVKVFHVVAWGIPLIIVSVAGGLDVLGLDVTDPLEHSKEMTVSLTGGWCFIRSPANQSVFSSNGSLNFVSQSPEWFSDVWFDFWVMMASVAWQIATFFFCVIIYLLIKIHIYKEKHRSSQVFVTHRLLRTADSVDRKLTFIPIVFFLLYICAVIRSFGRIFHSHHIIYNKPLIVLQGIFDSLQGAANCVIFCLFTKAVRNRIAACICSYCPRSSHHSRQQRGVNVNQSHRVVTSEYFNEPMFDRKKSADWPDCRGYSGNSEVTPLVHDVR